LRESLTVHCNEWENTMKYLRVLFAVVLCVAMPTATGYAKDVGKLNKDRQIRHLNSFKDAVRDLGATPVAQPLRAAAQAGTTILGSWGFETGAPCGFEGWTTLDRTAGGEEQWHVDDFAGLGGGDYGLLLPLQGNQSAWCGTRSAPTDPVLCGYQTLPGYGNSWEQYICSVCFTVTGNVVINYLAAWDSEPGYDPTFIEYDLCDGNWIGIESSANSRIGGAYHGFSPTIFDTVVVDGSLHTGTVRLRFHFSSDAGFSDEDGIWNTDGAIILDSLVVADDTGQISYEDFELAAVGDLGAGDWNSCNPPGYGDFAAVYPGVEVLQQDPCASDASCLWGFFNGSTANYDCGGWPGVAAVPYLNSRGQFIQNHIVSPVIPWVGSGSAAELTFAVYRDLPLDNLIFYEWQIRSWHGDCPSAWLTDWGVYFGPNKDWFGEIFPFGQFVEPGATGIQLSIGVRDMCPFWCGSEGTGACHSHAPLIDNVEVYRVATSGPQWSVNDFDLFQDNFATNGTLTGTVRIDAAQDILDSDNPNIVPGDSATVNVSDPESGIDQDAYTGFGPAVYGFVRVDPINPAKAGAVLSDDSYRFPVVDSVLSVTGDTWYVVRCDTVFAGVSRDAGVPDWYCLDLNDDLLVPGDTLWFFFGAKSAGIAATWNYYFHASHVTESIGVGARLSTFDIEEAMNNAEEMTCLPAAGLAVGNDILYVDDFSGRSGQPYFDTAFEQLDILDRVDRFDVRRPDANIGNGLGSRVMNVQQQLIPVYKKIIWHSGNLNDGLIGDGIAASEKSDDFFTLFTFIDLSNRAPGLWISGDYIATEWATQLGASAQSLRNLYMNFNVATMDHKAMGLPITPYVVGAPGGAFDNIIGPDSMYAYGGCNLINEFDVLQRIGVSTIEAVYEGNMAYPAILSQRTLNSVNSMASVMLSGYSYHYIRDDRAVNMLDRVTHLRKVLQFLGNTLDQPVAVGPNGYVNSLSQNRPNPFNPTTTIDYTVREQGLVRLQIYNVAGQLVRTLVDEVRSPGDVHTATWDGRSNAGQTVSSGVYFYKLVTGDFVQTKKMVLLK
jgi:hypothetical protein